MSSIYDFSIKTVNNGEISLEKFKGKTLLIVNVASKCGFTNQYADLEIIYKKYKSKGLEILAFPCNQFGAQEPGNAEEIKAFCTSQYDITFEIFRKIDVNGPTEEPLFKFLKEKLPGVLGFKNIKWNFTKFLIDKNGMPVKRYSPTVAPMDLLTDIQRIL